MKNFELDKISMYNTVMTLFNRSKETWQAFPFISNTVKQLEDNINALIIQGGNQTVNAKGAAEQKKEFRRKLETEMLIVSNLIKAYASVNQNQSLYNEMVFTRTSLKVSRDKILAFDAGKLMDIVIANAAGLNNFGITPEAISRFELKIAAFDNILNLPALEFKLKKEATVEIKRLIKETDYLLKNILDGQMGIFKTQNDAFYMNYIFDRKINGSPTIKQAMQVLVLDAETQMPLPGALVVIKDHRINRKTSPMGRIIIRNLKEGNHTISVSLDGYEQVKHQATYVKGETTKVKIELRKIQ